MLTFQPAKTLTGKLKLSPSRDLFFITCILALARKKSVEIAKPPLAPIIDLWESNFRGHLEFTRTNEQLTIHPVHEDPSIRISFKSTKLPWRDFCLFALLGMGKTVVFSSIDDARITYFKKLGKRIGCTIETSAWESSTCISCSSPLSLPAESSLIDECDQDALCGLLVGSSVNLSFISDTVFTSPARIIAPLFGFSIDVKSTVERERDPFARRLNQIRQKQPSPAVSGQQFSIIVSCQKSASDANDAIVVTLPGDAPLAATFTAAKCLFPKTSFIIENVNLESWATPFLSFIRKMGTKVSVQETARTSYGSCGIIHLQGSELTGKKLECTPSSRYEPFLPALLVIAAFSKGESVFRGLSDLRNDTPDGIDFLENCLRSFGVRHGEMPDGIVLQGGTDFDSFDLTGPTPAYCSAAFAIAAAKVHGSSTIDDAELLQWYPDFSAVIAEHFEYRTHHEKN